MAHEWSPADLPSNFKLFEWDFARNDKITLDANGGIASIADTWNNRLAVTTSTAARRTLATFTNGVQGAYKPGNGSDTQANGLSLNDTSLLPVGSADRYLGFAVVHADGILGGYGDNSHDYWLDTPFSPGYRVHLEGTNTTNPLSVNRTDPHFVELETISGVTTLWVDGVNAGTYNTALATTATKFGIAGYDQSYYTMNGYTFYVPVGKRGRTTDERYLLQAWVAKYKTKRTPPSDNPYRPAAAGGSDLPMVADGGTTVTPSSASQAHVTTASTVSARSTVQPSTGSHQQVGTSPTAGVRSVTQPNTANQSHLSSSPVLSSRALVVVDSASQSQQAASPTIGNVRAALSPDNAAQTNGSTQPAVQTGGSITPASGTMSQVATSPVLAFRVGLSVNSGVQTQVATSPAIFASGSIAPAGASQVNYVTSPALAMRYRIVPASGAHIQIASSPVLTVRASLSVNSVVQIQIATSPSLFAGMRPVPPSARTVRSIRPPRIVVSSRLSRLAA